MCQAIEAATQSKKSTSSGGVGKKIFSPASSGSSEILPTNEVKFFAKVSNQRAFSVWCWGSSSTAY